MVSRLPNLKVLRIQIECEPILCNSGDSSIDDFYSRLTRGLNKLEVLSLLLLFEDFPEGGEALIPKLVRANPHMKIISLSDDYAGGQRSTIAAGSESFRAAANLQNFLERFCIKHDGPDVIADLLTLLRGKSRHKLRHISCKHRPVPHDEMKEQLIKQELELMEQETGFKYVFNFYGSHCTIKCRE